VSDVVQDIKGERKREACPGAGLIQQERSKSPEARDYTGWTGGGGGKKRYFPVLTKIVKEGGGAFRSSVEVCIKSSWAAKKEKNV